MTRPASTDSDADRYGETFDDDDGAAFGGAGFATVDSLLADEVVFVSAEASVAEVATALTEADVGLLVVGSAEHVVGVVSERDVVHAVARGLTPDTPIVELVEPADLRWATTDAPIDDVANEMLMNHLRHLLVGADDGTLAGVVSMRDVLAMYVR